MKNYPGEIILFRPKLDKRYQIGSDLWLTSELEYAYEDNQWTPYVERLEIFEVPGDHDSMVLEPNVRVMAQKLRDIIMRAEAGGAM